MVLKEANQMNTQCNGIRQFLCKNSIEMLYRAHIWQIDGLERRQLPNLGNGLERSQSNEYTMELGKSYVKTPLK